MPTFDTPQPISVELDIVVADIRIEASDRADTIVDIRPSNESQDRDVRVAAQTRVDFVNGRLKVIGPRPPALGLFGKAGSIDVRIELPTGSALRGDGSVATYRCDGRFGECRVKTSVGDVHFGHTGPLDLHTGAGNVAVESVDGRAEVDTGSGRIRLGQITGSAVVKSSNGDTWIGAITGDLRANSANGDIRVDRATAGVTANTANGSVSVGGITRGSVELSTAIGQIDIGIEAGTAAKLDVQTKFGRVVNELDAASAPGPADETATVRARNSFGDIVIRRSNTNLEG